ATGSATARSYAGLLGKRTKHPRASGCKLLLERTLKSYAQKRERTREVAKPGTKGRPPGAKGGGRATRAQFVEATIETLKREGFAGASARAIARTGGFNQSLIFYHFGS